MTDETRSTHSSQSIATPIGVLGSAIGVIVAARSVGYVPTMLVAGALLFALGVMRRPAASGIWLPSDPKRSVLRRFLRAPTLGGAGLLLAATIWWMLTPSHGASAHLQATYVWNSTPSKWPSDWNVNLVRNRALERWVEWATLCSEADDILRNATWEGAEQRLRDRGVRLPPVLFDRDAWDTVPLTRVVYAELAKLGWRSVAVDRLLESGMESAGQVASAGAAECGDDEEGVFDLFWVPPRVELFAVVIENKSSKTLSSFNVSWEVGRREAEAFSDTWNPGVGGVQEVFERVSILKPSERVVLPVTVGFSVPDSGRSASADSAGEVEGGADSPPAIVEAFVSAQKEASFVSPVWGKVDYFDVFRDRGQRDRMYDSLSAMNVRVTYMEGSDGYQMDVHDYDPDKTFLIRGGWEGGSCPHVWVATTSGEFELGEVLERQRGVCGWDFMALPPQVARVELRNPLGEQALIRECWLRTEVGWESLLDRAVEMQPGESMRLELDPASEPGLMAFFGAYRKIE